jgi:hypothetical protein
MTDKLTTKFQSFVLNTITGIGQVIDAMKNLIRVGDTTASFTERLGPAGIDPKLQTQLEGVNDTIRKLKENAAGVRANMEGMTPGSDAYRAQESALARINASLSQQESLRDSINKKIAEARKLEREAAAATSNTPRSSGDIGISGLTFNSNKALEGWDKTNKRLRREISALVQDAKKEGINFTITSTFRDGSGKSRHNYGQAVDLVADNWEKATQWWRANSHKYELSFPVRTERPGDQAGTTFGTGPHWHAQLAAAQDKRTASVERLTKATNAQREAVYQLSEAERAQSILVSEGLRIYEQTRTPQEELIGRLQRLRELLSAGALPGGEDTFIRAVTAANDVYRAATEGAEAAVTKTNELAASIRDNLQGAFGSWINSAVEGTFRLRDALRELAQDIARLALRFAANQLFSSLAGGGDGGGGLLGSLLGSLFAKGAAFPQLALPQGVYTQPTYFPMPQGGPLKRYARGGVLGEAGAEAVLPLRRLPNGKLGVEGIGGGTEVVINNYTGEAVSRRTRQLGDREIVEIAIGQMEERVSRGGNSTSRSLQQAFGLRRGR